MAMILAFTPRKAASGAFSAPLAKAGDVIIFPGVRYEQAEPRQSEEAYADDRRPAGDGSGEPRH